MDYICLYVESGGVLDVCLCLGCVDVSGVGGEWDEGSGQGQEG